jgi:DNA-directed RNA polymerase subunit RPC12/RpoP
MDALTLHDLAEGRLPVGVECDHCIRRAVVSPETLKATRGDTRTLAEAGLRCGKCGSRRFTTTRFHSRPRLKAFMRNL